MKDKHVDIRIKQCLAIATASNCPRKQVGALLLDPDRNVILADGYNGAPRNGGDLCGGDCCLRDNEEIPSGTHIEVGCHHAEMNVICNAAANGIPTNGAWLFVTCSCCMMCAKLVHHAGITKVIVIANNYSTEEGMEYLIEHGIEIERCSYEF